MSLELIRIENDATTEDIIGKILLPGADSIIVQLPLPAHIDTEAVLNAIPVELDADVLSAEARRRFEAGSPEALLPPVVGAIKEILERSQVQVEGKRTVVLGQGWLVGEPAALWLGQQGAQVEVVDRADSLESLKDAEIIISGAGSPRLITPERVSSGVVIIDAGTSESNGAIVGDATPECADIASVFTPVPGGVGPVAVACLFQNAALLTGLQTR
jgi:methylenetetrahydrofolate dehydrogenase (NADP+)/methenyltetrahydrofolate cyclohydrolase